MVETPRSPQRPQRGDFDHRIDGRNCDARSGDAPVARAEHERQQAQRMGDVDSRADEQNPSSRRRSDDGCLHERTSAQHAGHRGGRDLASTADSVRDFGWTRCQDGSDQ
jgi:hypothetical protein